ISGKELRYLLELYGSLYDRAVLGGVARELKALQDNLGEFQDCEIHAQRLHEYASELRATADVPTSSLMAVALVAQVFIDPQAHAPQRRPPLAAAVPTTGPTSTSCPPTSATAIWTCSCTTPRGPPAFWPSSSSPWPAATTGSCWTAPPASRWSPKVCWRRSTS